MVIASGTTYIVMQSKNTVNETTKNNDKVNDEQDNTNDNKTKEDLTPEKITLKEEELKKYLSYVPYRESLTEKDDNINAYLNNLKLTDLSDKYLTEYALKLANYKSFENFDLSSDFIVKVSTKEIKNILKKAYNKEIESFKTGRNSNGQEYYQINCMGFVYKDDSFYGRYGCGGLKTKIEVIGDYKIEDNDLIIYEYVGIFDDIIGDIYNIKNDKNITNISKNSEEDYDVYTARATAYVQEHKTEFPKYKHTFKKNDTGYYWYSTEAIN